MTVTVLAGTPLHVLDDVLLGLGLALHNLGDIDRQTVAGAIATGTHGTGGRRGVAVRAGGRRSSWSPPTASVVHARPDGTGRGGRPARGRPGRARRARHGHRGDVPGRARLHARARSSGRCPGRPCVDGFDDLVAAADHFEAYWFPHTDRMLTKSNNRSVEAAHPLSPLRAYVDDELLANPSSGPSTGSGTCSRAASRPSTGSSSRALSARTYSDVSHRVLTSPRRVVSGRWSTPCPARPAWRRCARPARSSSGGAGGSASRSRSGTPPPTTPGCRRRTGATPCYLAFHVNARTDHRAYFAGVEQVLRAYDGRPHWGKLHTRAAADLAPAYPRFEDFVALRDRVDPDRLFTNAYLDRVPGADVTTRPDMTGRVGLGLPPPATPGAQRRTRSRSSWAASSSPARTPPCGCWRPATRRRTTCRWPASSTGALRPAAGGSFCEWKGQASYVDVARRRPGRAERAGWYYPTPTRAYAEIVDHVALYPGAMDRCTVDGEEVRPQPGGFYGGWVTSQVVGPFKGDPGTMHW